MFLIDDLRKLATDAGHAIDGEVHKFLTFVEDKVAAVTPHVSFGRPDPVQPRPATPTVVVTRPSIIEQVAPTTDATPVAEPAPTADATPVTEPVPTTDATDVVTDTANEDHPGS